MRVYLLAGCAVAGVVVLAALILAAVCSCTRRPRRPCCTSTDPERDMRGKSLESFELKSELAVAKALGNEIRPQPAELVCKSVFTDSALPDQHDWAVRSSWDGRFDNYAKAQSVRHSKARKLTEGVSAPLPEPQSKVSWALQTMLSAEPPFEVSPPHTAPCLYPPMQEET